MSTIKDVAERAGVSPATVSRVLNGLDGFTAETAVRVRAAVQELNYRPDAVARGLKLRTSSLIGVLAPKVSDALASEIVAGVENAARAQGRTVMYGRTGELSTFATSYLRTLRAYHAAGVVLISALPNEGMRADLGTRIPVVSVAITDGSPAPAVSVDDFAAAHAATRHLQQLGHQRIAVVSGNPESVHVGERRLAGYRKAMSEAGAAPDVVPGDFTYEGGVRAVRTLLQRSEPLPTAIFALSDEMGVAAINELHRAGIDVPGQVSVLGFDNTTSSRHVHPQPSTVAQPLFQMGEAAVAMLLDQRHLGRKTVPHKILERASTGRAPGGNPNSSPDHR